jgi:hypothetical protein
MIFMLNVLCDGSCFGAVAFPVIIGMRFTSSGNSFNSTPRLL